MMKKWEMDEVLDEVCEEYDKPWYEVVDSELMDEVAWRIADRTGKSLERLYDDKTWIEWSSQLAWDL